MVYTSENFDANKDFAANFTAELLTENYTKKSLCRRKSLSPGLILANFLKTSFFKYVSPGFVKFLKHWNTKSVLE